MRKALFVIVLVGASFAGGAVINGPGLHWAQTLVMNRLGIAEDKGPEVVVAGGELAGPRPIEEIPSSPIPPLVLDPIDPKKKPAAEKQENVVAQSTRPLPVLSPVPEPVPPPLEPLTTSKDREHDALVLAASTTEGPTPAAAISGVPNDWTAVRRELKVLGVSRYGTEGEPSGRVRFHCVIPLAGRRAVGQHFEAEGDDELQAARAAIKRVALWRATEGEPSAR